MVTALLRTIISLAFCLGLSGDLLFLPVLKWLLWMSRDAATPLALSLIRLVYLTWLLFPDGESWVRGDLCTSVLGRPLGLLLDK